MPITSSILKKGITPMASEPYLHSAVKLSSSPQAPTVDHAPGGTFPFRGVEVKSSQTEFKLSLNYSALLFGAIPAQLFLLSLLSMRYTCGLDS